MSELASGPLCKITKYIRRDRRNGNIYDFPRLELCLDMLQTLHQQLTFLADLFCDQCSKGTGQENRQSQQEEQAKHFHTGKSAQRQNIKFA